MARDPIPTWFFALVVVRLGHRFLLVQERKHEQRWYLPAGRVETGERLVDAARRETLEETGVPVVVEGILRLEHTPQVDGSARCRIVFVARPKDDTPPKQEPDQHSLRAGWFTLEDMQGLDLRGPEVLALFADVSLGAPVYPLSLLSYEGARS